MFAVLENLLFPEIMKRGHELQAFKISAEKIVEKYSLNTECHVYRRNAEIEHVYQELYAHLTLPHPSLPFSDRSDAVIVQPDAFCNSANMHKEILRTPAGSHLLTVSDRSENQ